MLGEVTKRSGAVDFLMRGAARKGGRSILHQPSLDEFPRGSWLAGATLRGHWGSLDTSTSHAGSARRWHVVAVQDGIMQNRNLSSADVTNAVEHYHIFFPSGDVKIGDKDIALLSNSMFMLPELMGDIPIKTVADRGHRESGQDSGAARHHDGISGLFRAAANGAQPGTRRRGECTMRPSCHRWADRRPDHDPICGFLSLLAGRAGTNTIARRFHKAGLSWNRT